MALKKYTKTTYVTPVKGEDPVDFIGADGFSVYNSIIRHDQAIADNAIIPYHSVLFAKVVNGSVDAEMVNDTACPTGDSPTPSGTVIFDGDVEWTYNQDVGAYMAKIDTQSEILLYSELDVTVNGENYIGYYISQDAPTFNVGDIGMIAHVEDDPDIEDGWYLIVGGESEPSASVRIVQNPMEWTLLYSGNVTTHEDNGLYVGHFNAPFDFIGETVARGTINGSAVTGTVFGQEDGGEIQFDGYTLTSSDNGDWTFTAPAEMTYSLNIEYLPSLNTEPTT